MRTNFPARRQGDSFTFDLDGLGYHAIANKLPNGDLGEIFMDAGKVGSSAYNIGKELAVVFSLACQWGVPLNVIREALPRLHDGRPAGPLGVALDLVEGT